jgi:hypothetical protein
MKANLQQAIGLLGQAQTLIDTNINSLSGQIDNSIFEPLFAFMKQDSDGTLAALVAKLQPLVDAIPDGN